VTRPDTSPLASLRRLGRLRERVATPSDRARDSLAAAVAGGATSPEIVIIGAGAGGLAMGAQLRAAGVTSFRIVEKSDGVGGTWRDNSYPGAACDVPSHLYSLSFASWGRWSRKFAPQPEILRYFEWVADRFGLRDHIETNREVASLDYDDGSQRWRIGLVTGEVEYADIVVSALGQLNRPFVPEIAGRDRFAGEQFHSARWRRDVDLVDRDIAVIGNGASAVQFVPEVAKVARSLTVFQRSANWIIPKPDRPYRRFERRLLEQVPPARHLHRWWIYWRLEANVGLMRSGSLLGRLIERRVSSELGKLVSPRLSAEALIPDYSPGCKRLLISNDYYATLLRPNVSVTTSPVREIAADAIVTEDGVAHTCDLLIWGTGFRASEFLAPIAVSGPQGRRLSDAWSEGARAHLGMAIEGFPNLFLLYGPNTNLGHNSILFMIEAQVRLIVQLVDVMVRERRTSVEVDPLAFEASNRDVRERLAASVWATGCESWYKNAAGTITNNWPGSTLAYWRRLRTARANDWRFSGRAGR
jgi:cation diffusion facilitator CzcD-associated flavoprotein CzcO